MSERYWLVHPNGGRQLIDPRQFDLDRLVEQAREVGGRLEVEGETYLIQTEVATGSSIEVTRRPAPRPDRPPHRFEPPISALGPLFRSRPPDPPNPVRSNRPSRRWGRCS